MSELVSERAQEPHDDTDVDSSCCASEGVSNATAPDSSCCDSTADVAQTLSAKPQSESDCVQSKDDALISPDNVAQVDSVSQGVILYHVL